MPVLTNNIYTHRAAEILDWAHRTKSLRAVTRRHVSKAVKNAMRDSAYAYYHYFKFDDGSVEYISRYKPSYFSFSEHPHYRGRRRLFDMRTFDKYFDSTPCEACGVEVETTRQNRFSTRLCPSCLKRVAYFKGGSLENNIALLLIKTMELTK